MDESPQIEEWRKEFGEIDAEASVLLHNRNVFREIRTIMVSSPRLTEPPVVFNWLHEAYVAQAAFAVRRQMDPDVRVASLVRLLTSIATCPYAITRSWFVNRYAARPSRAHSDFDKFDHNRQGFVSADTVREDLAKFEAAGKAVRSFTNTYLAHRNKEVALKRKRGPQLTWGQLDRAIDLLAALVKKYGLLLTQEEPSLELPVGTAWRKVFCYPWIPPEKREPQRIQRTTTRQPST